MLLSVFFRFVHHLMCVCVCDKDCSFTYLQFKRNTKKKNYMLFDEIIKMSHHQFVMVAEKAATFVPQHMLCPLYSLFHFIFFT